MSACFLWLKYPGVGGYGIAAMGGFKSAALFEERVCPCVPGGAAFVEWDEACVHQGFVKLCDVLLGCDGWHPRFLKW